MQITKVQEMKNAFLLVVMDEFVEKVISLLTTYTFKELFFSNIKEYMILTPHPLTLMLV